MRFLKKHGITPQIILKYSLYLLAGVAILALFINLFDNPGMRMGGFGISSQDSMTEEYSAPGNAARYRGDIDGGTPGLGMRNILIDPAPPSPGYAPGADAEAFEVKDYSVTYESGDSARECDAVSALKGREDVIFESSSEYDRGCSYSFKVKNASVEDVLSILKELDPREVSENAHTIKNVVNDYTSREEILAEKLATINATLEGAITAYDEVTALATASQDAESLAKIIDSKIAVIERLTIERANINAELERLARAKADELDRLEYTYFSVSAYENPFVDGKGIKDSWKQALRETVSDMNEAVQGLTVGLVSVLLFLLQIAVYAAILLFVAKYGWRFAKEVWNR